MLIIKHRVNKIQDLLKTPREYGVEIDVRGYGNRLLLNHDPIDDPKRYGELENYLQNFQHAFIIFNLKEAGYEQRVIDLAEKYNIEDYFLLDVEFPYLYNATRKQGFRKIAVRYSEAEPIEAVEAQIQNGESLLDWVWVDTNTIFPLNKESYKKLKDANFKLCLVCPDRWGRPEDIQKYIKYMKENNIELDAVMTNKEKEWALF